MGEYICKNCGEECSIVAIDEGIGHYEYFGAKGYDSRIVHGSDCCECDVVDEEGYPVEASDIYKEMEEERYADFI